MNIEVGIPTSGSPLIERQGEFHLLKNMLIGKDFHWQRSISALLPGEVRVTEGNVFQVINILPVETYLKCVVGSEMNPSAPIEFLKAHAVISRSWAMGKVLRKHNDSDDGKTFSDDRIISWEDTGDHVGFDVCSDDHCQRYQGIQPISPEALSAIESTEGEVLLSPSGTLIDARFSKCCGGRTEVFSTCWQDREEDCLEAFDDPWCDMENIPKTKREKILTSILKDYDLSTSGGFRWELEITAEEIEENLKNKFGKNIGRITDMEIVARGKSGRAKELKLIGSDGTMRIGKELMIRRLLAPTHLYSSWFEIETLSPGRWRLNGHGWGHGVGLCQIGAARMALEGFSYKEILSFYYPGAKIGKMDFDAEKKELIMESTADGSVTLYRPDMDEHYHSVKGALTESRHVYLDLGWKEASRFFNEVNVFEVGFGTGLNAALTAEAALRERIPTRYYSVELYPLPSGLSSSLTSMQEETYRGEFIKINEAEWNKPVQINPYFTLHKISADLLSMKIPENINVIYFDAFAPEKQPEMWSPEIFRRLFESLAPGGIITTYCAKGAIRRMLSEIGFITERLPGPPGGKREILRGRKPIS